MKKCISCRERTTSTVVGQIGSVVGPICDECEFWCDGNILTPAGATA